MLYRSFFYSVSLHVKNLNIKTTEYATTIERKRSLSSKRKDDDIKDYRKTELKEDDYISRQRHLGSSQKRLKQMRLLPKKRCINGTDLLNSSFSLGTNLMLMGFYLYILLKWLKEITSHEFTYISRFNSYVTIHYDTKYINTQR